MTRLKQMKRDALASAAAFNSNLQLASAGPAPQTPSTAQLQQANMQARQLVVQRGLNMWQQIASGAVASVLANNVINIPIRNVGLVKRLVIELSITLAQSAAETFTRTQWGPANLLSNVVLTDLNNQQRINTAGWHLHALATARRQMAFGAAFTNDSPVNIGSNFNVIVAPTPITTVQTIRMFYELPISYGDYDLRGAIYANVVNATMNLQMTFNPNFVVATGADATLAAYQSSTGSLGTLGSLNYTIYQNYLDQVPMSSNGPILPLMDLSTAYILTNTSVTGLTVGQDLPIPLANFRDFMSVFAIYDNVGVLNAGTDINYVGLQSANFTFIQKYDPFMSSLLTRTLIGDDFPKGTYYFDFRNKPVATIQYGNMQLIINPSAVTSAVANVLLGYEMLALINQVTNAGSLYGN